jgi:hypothetical protein
MTQPAAAPAATAEKATKTRAAKAVEAATAPTTTPEPEVDPFAAAEETPKYTRDDVRKALLACQERVGPAAAQAVFKKAAGVDTLPNLKDESKFAVVIAAANAAK